MTMPMTMPVSSAACRVSMLASWLPVRAVLTHDKQTYGVLRYGHDRTHDRTHDHAHVRQAAAELSRRESD
jgi:hypothetical protein